jgi:hypothetical protein
MMSVGGWGRDSGSEEVEERRRGRVDWAKLKRPRLRGC